MALKIFRGVWFVTLMATLATLLYVYAGLPEDVVVQEEGVEFISLSKEALFYLGIALIALVNVLVYIIAKLFGSNEAFCAWFHGLIITLDLFFIVALFLLSVYNSNEQFDYNRIGFIIYGSLILIVIWALAWPFFNLFKKFYNKEALR